MTGIIIFLKLTAWPMVQKYWKPIAIGLLVLLILFYTYEKGVSRGEAACEEKHRIIEQKRDAVVNKKIDDLAAGSTAAANEAKKSSGLINKKIEDLIKASKDPLVVYKDGNCVPTKPLVDLFNNISKEANEK